MKWKNLKLFGIAVLLIIDIFFAISLVSIYLNKSAYTKEETDTAVSVLEKSGITVFPELIADKSEKFVYSGETGTNVYSVYIGIILGDGVTISYDVGETKGKTDAGEEIYIYSTSRFEYRIAEKYQFPDTDGGYADGYEKEVFDTDTSEYYVGLINGLMKSDAISKRRENRSAVLKCTVELSELYSSGDTRLAVFDLYIGDFRTKERIFCLCEEKIVSASGMLPYTYPTEKIAAKTTDIMDIMFSEKAYFDELGENISLKVASIDTVYRYYPKTETGYCYIPECIIVYDNGLVRTYNFITGKLVTG